MNKKGEPARDAKAPVLARQAHALAEEGLRGVAGVLPRAVRACYIDLLGTSTDRTDAVLRRLARGWAPRAMTRLEQARAVASTACLTWDRWESVAVADELAWLHLVLEEYDAVIRVIEREDSEREPPPYVRQDHWMKAEALRRQGRGREAVRYIDSLGDSARSSEREALDVIRRRIEVGPLDLPPSRSRVGRRGRPEVRSLLVSWVWPVFFAVPALLLAARTANPWRLILSTFGLLPVVIWTANNGFRLLRDSLLCRRLRRLYDDTERAAAARGVHAGQTYSPHGSAGPA